MHKKINIFEYAYYYEIICRLIYEFRITSEVKLLFLSFAIKNISEDYKGSARKYNAYELILNGIGYNIFQRINEFCILFDCINILKSQKYIETKSGKIIIANKPEYSRTIDCLDSPLLYSSIIEIEKLSDDSLIRGILEYV